MKTGSDIAGITLDSGGFRHSANCPKIPSGGSIYTVAPTPACLSVTEDLGNYSKGFC